ncbi:AraC family transcriptional regulator [Paenibacillus sp. PsM32]|uniref:AraC family transcriptional regulator n=1 Tax=Paenibacillus sp. PsM32 TaxID=3030536 RepID=UPI00263B4016|nr:AraC family transcriptional regulator [Paenibacillus sp. PsM32]MDN4618086.1 AraC family transcriptional regulator [Paenibacillus sp. PsM32]
MDMLDIHATTQSRELLEVETSRLADLLSIHANKDGSYESKRISGLYFNRYSKVEKADYTHTMYWPTVGIAAQGKKVIEVGNEIFEYGGSTIFVAPVALPVMMKTIIASPSDPFLGVGIYLNPQRIAELVPKVFPQGLPKVSQRSPGYMLPGDLGFIHAVARLVDCLSSSSDSELLAPLIVDEIFIRLLRSPIGVFVAETVFVESNVQRVAKAVRWLHEHFAQPLKIPELADMVHLSQSSFREHFKSVTSMSPLQYQKALRLQEARRLMLSGHMDAITACRMVGYISDSQFSRDYSRFFGSPPSRDRNRWR